MGCCNLGRERDSVVLLHTTRFRVLMRGSALDDLKKVEQKGWFTEIVVAVVFGCSTLVTINVKNN